MLVVASAAKVMNMLLPAVTVTPDRAMVPVPAFVLTPVNCSCNAIVAAASAGVGANGPKGNRPNTNARTRDATRARLSRDSRIPTS